MTEQEMDLKEYVEGRFSRLVTDIEDKLKALSRELRDIITSNDLRYQQRFEAQGKELDKAFSAAKEAVNAALVGADKAAAKTEVSADKRFADLGELIKEQFNGLRDKFDASIKRLEILEKRINTTSGESEGSKSMWGYVAGAIVIIIGVAGIVLTAIHLMK